MKRSQSGRSVGRKDNSQEQKQQVVRSSTRKSSHSENDTSSSPQTTRRSRSLSKDDSKKVPDTPTRVTRQNLTPKGNKGRKTEDKETVTPKKKTKLSPENKPTTNTPLNNKKETKSLKSKDESGKSPLRRSGRHDGHSPGSLQFLRNPKLLTDQEKTAWTSYKDQFKPLYEALHAEDQPASDKESTVMTAKDAKHSKGSKEKSKQEKKEGRPESKDQTLSTPNSARRGRGRPKSAVEVREEVVHDNRKDKDKKEIGQSADDVMPKRGRPRKAEKSVTDEVVDDNRKDKDKTETGQSENDVMSKRGRPRKTEKSDKTNSVNKDDERLSRKRKVVGDHATEGSESITSSSEPSGNDNNDEDKVVEEDCTGSPKSKKKKGSRKRDDELAGDGQENSIRDTFDVGTSDHSYPAKQDIKREIINEEVSVLSDDSSPRDRSSRVNRRKYNFSCCHCNQGFMLEYLLELHYKSCAEGKKKKQLEVKAKKSIIETNDPKNKLSNKTSAGKKSSNKMVEVSEQRSQSKNEGKPVEKSKVIEDFGEKPEIVEKIVDNIQEKSTDSSTLHTDSTNNDKHSKLEMLETKEKTTNESSVVDQPSNIAEEENSSKTDSNNVAEEKNEKENQLNISNSETMLVSEALLQMQKGVEDMSTDKDNQREVIIYVKEPDAQGQEVTIEQIVIRENVDEHNEDYASSQDLQQAVEKALLEEENIPTAKEVQTEVSESVLSPPKRKQKKKSEDEFDGDNLSQEALNSLQCPTCDKKFKAVEYLRRHMIVHTDDAKQLKCEVCSKCFTRKYDLQIHLMRLHNWVRAGRGIVIRHQDIEEEGEIKRWDKEEGEIPKRKKENGEAKQMEKGDGESAQQEEDRESTQQEEDGEIVQQQTEDGEIIQQQTEDGEIVQQQMEDGEVMQQEQEDQENGQQEKDGRVDTQRKKDGKVVQQERTDKEKEDNIIQQEKAEIVQQKEKDKTVLKENEIVEQEKSVAQNKDRKNITHKEKEEGKCKILENNNRQNVQETEEQTEISHTDKRQDRTGGEINQQEKEMETEKMNERGNDKETDEKEKQEISEKDKSSQTEQESCMCAMCGKEFIAQKFLEKHISRYHESGEKGNFFHDCQQCNARFENIRDLQNHLKSHGTEKVFKCDKCTKSFYRLPHLIRHSYTHLTDRNFKCTECDKCYKDPDALKKHMKSSHQGEEGPVEVPRQYKCGQCSKVFNSPHYLKRHEFRHTGARPFECKTCGKFFAEKNSLLSHSRIHTGERPYKCEDCGRAFVQASHLNRHRFLHTQIRNVECEKCGKKFFEKSDLSKHLKQHDEIRPYKCDICEMAFSQKSTLVCHRRRHTGEKPYQCDICSRRFTQLSSLQTHHRLHTGERPYKCQYCDQGFVSKERMKVHQFAHTGVHPHVCNICGKGFRLKFKLQNHLDSHHGVFRHKCQFCDKGFNEKGRLNRHVKMVHEGNIVSIDSSSGRVQYTQHCVPQEIIVQNIPQTEVVQDGAQEIVEYVTIPSATGDDNTSETSHAVSHITLEEGSELSALLESMPQDSVIYEGEDEGGKVVYVVIPEENETVVLS